ncbi:putative glucooligosaccharide oxidase [Hypomontagnella monticulosa]|nr:putative glucooligosaccharide oxidase [Hypomontagnella monticulosa]
MALTTTNIQSFVRRLLDGGVPVIDATHHNWHRYSATYNVRLPVTPAAVVIPTTLSEIARVVTLAKQHGLKVQARSGGHSYASYSNGGVDGTVVIDLRRFQVVRHGIATPIIAIGSGLRLGNLAKRIYDTNGGPKYALPHGTCAGVGVGGHFTHGGFGLFSRAWGLAMDRVRSMCVVTADGRWVEANRETNPDLFYAMQGAADSFGIATTLQVEAVPAPRSVVHYIVEICDVVKSVESAVNALCSIQNFTHNANVVDRNLGFAVRFGPNYIALEGTYLGDIRHLETTIVPAMLTGIPETPNNTNIQEVNWLTSLKMLNQNQEIEIPGEYDGHSNFFAKSIVIPEPGFTVEAMRSFFTYLLSIGDSRPVDYFILFDLYGGPDSQVSNKDINYSAFAHRDALWVVQIYGYANNDQDFPWQGLDFINGLANSITAYLPRYGAYSNYTDPSLTRAQAHRLYYGDTLYAKLKDLKSKWDPDNVFANPQSI